MTVDIALPHSAPDRIGQGTAIEQSRAAAEVYYRVAAAKQMPRDEDAAIAAMRVACSNLRLAEQAFYSVPKGGERAIGPSVHLARELARIWGNIDYGVVELRRDDEHGQSEMQAFAWDLQTNARPSTLWIQPHKMDTKKGVKKLVEVQAIYELNSNAGARRVREQIFAVLPKAFVDEAQEACRATLARGTGESLEVRITKAVQAFATTFAITEQQLADRLGRAPARWDEQDVADLSVLFKSLKAGEVQKDVEFPHEQLAVTAEELAKPPAAASRRGRKAAEPELEQRAETDEEALLREQQEMEAELAAETAGETTETGA